MNHRQLHTNEHYFLFRIGKQIYAFSASMVREVARCPEVIRIPRTTSLLAGMCHLRNEFLPVLDLTPLSGGTQDASPSEAQLLVMSGNEGSWAILIDRALGLEELDTACTTEVDWQDEWSRALLGTGSHPEGIVRVLDAHALYRLAVLTQHDHWESERQMLVTADRSEHDNTPVQS